MYFLPREPWLQRSNNFLFLKFLFSSSLVSFRFARAPYAVKTGTRLRARYNALVHEVKYQINFPASSPWLHSCRDIVPGPRFTRRCPAGYHGSPATSEAVCPFPLLDGNRNLSLAATLLIIIPQGCT